MALRLMYAATFVIALVVTATAYLIWIERTEYSPVRERRTWSPTSVGAALAGLNSPHLDVRRKSLAYLKETRDPSGLEKARQILLADPIPGISGDAAEYLATMQDDFFANCVLAGEQYTVPQKLNIISALTGSSTRGSLKALRMLSKDSSAEVRNASSSLLYYRERGLEPPFKW